MPLIDEYKNLITSEHKDKPKFMAMVTTLLEYSDAIFECAIYLDDEFDLDLAEGNQEDILGEIVGANRVLDFQPDKGLSPILDNFAYRNLLKAKIAQNMWKGGIYDLNSIWKVLFGEGIIIQDNQNMTIDVVVIGEGFDQITKNLIQKGYIVPKPQSVAINYSFSDGPVFGYDMETSTIRGYDHANWQDPNPKDSFSYDLEDKKLHLFGYDECYWT